MNPNPSEPKQNIKFIFNIDRGGTFTDFYVQQIQHDKKPNSDKIQQLELQNEPANEYEITNQFIFKVPSISSQGQGPIVGIRNFLTQKGHMKQSNILIPIQNISKINLGTTIATNALLQRKGERNAMILTKGFKDSLTIRHQARPNIFDLKCERKSPLCTDIYEVDQRIYLSQVPQQFKCQRKVCNKHNGQIFIKSPEYNQLEQTCKQIKQKGIKSVGISFCHSIVDNQNQMQIKKYLQKEGFQYIELASQISQVGYLKRSETVSLNAFLNPIMSKYFLDFKNKFQNSQNLTLRIMKSDGGFIQSSKVKASQILLSGPAGGLIGYSKIINNFQSISGLKLKNLIGLDMGGTSTDVSRVQNKQFKIQQVSEIQGLFVCAPHLQIDTIAAGGGSKLTFQNGMFKVGPQSVGSNPGPVCYGKGQELALTDANFILNRLQSTYFPKVFGKQNNQGLNLNLSIKAFDQIKDQINQYNDLKKADSKSSQQIAQGFINIANQLMAKSARKLFTFGNPDALVVFGSAGGQHCCDLADKLSLDHIFIHRFSGVLSAYGLSKASQTIQKKYHLGLIVTKQSFNFQTLMQTVNKIGQDHNETSNTLIGSKYDDKQSYLMIGYVGTNYELCIALNQNALQVFEQEHKKANGFVLPRKQYRIEYLRQKFSNHPPEFKKQNKLFKNEQIDKFKLKEDKVFIEGQWQIIPFYDISEVTKSETQGPALLFSPTVTIFLKAGWKAIISTQMVYIKRNTDQSIINKNQNHVILVQSVKLDPIILTLYSTRLMAIAQEMGKVLERISISTNIKERLDFSCGIFDWNGKVLANAPHIPVHLGSMETAVTQQIKRGIKNGQSVLTNHPIAGGSHLPDLTVVTCHEISKDFRIFVASRGHHADIGGISPGSMPPFSKYLQQQGLAVEKFELINQNGQFKQKQVRQLFSQSRRIDDNVSDLLAQLAANKIGIKLLLKFIEEQGVFKFKSYIGHICQNAKECVQDLLVQFATKNFIQQIGSLQNEQYMDDGTKIKLKLTIDRKVKKAIFDFTGTQPQILGNTNAPYSITRSAILYCLRCLIGKEIPLNSGCLQPIQIIVPFGTILSPSKNCAVVGGNVETSQRIVDLILKPFKFVAASQGTMNNFLFGNQNVSYYETIGGGSGAGSNFHGTTGQVHMTNTRITDVQHLQRKYSIILRQFSIKSNSGGRGQHNGGDGLIRDFMFLQPFQVSILSQRRVFTPYGLFQGETGARGKNLYIQYSDQSIKSLGSKNSLKVNKFDRVRIQTPGGGGFGNKNCLKKI